MAYAGRGAWSKVGGTLKKVNGVTVPGPYYRRPTKGVPAPGITAEASILAGEVPDLNAHAVWYGVLAIKTRLHEMTGLVEAENLTMNGIYGTGVRDAVKSYQANVGLVADGEVGPKTAKAMFVQLNMEVGSWSAIGATIGCGVIQNESAWDPGAVGFVDYLDHGLCQLNAESQHFDREQSFDARTAMERMYLLLDANLALFGNEKDAIAAYNLGKAGCQLWIREGRPQWFIPLSLRPDGPSRDVWGYVTRIQSACA